MRLSDAPVCPSTRVARNLCCWEQRSRHAGSSSIVNSLLFHPSLANLSTQEYHVTHFQSCQLHNSIHQTQSGNTMRCLTRTSPLWSICGWEKSLIPGTFCTSLCPTVLVLKHYFCHNKGHASRKSNGMTAVLNLVLRPFLSEDTACIFLASHNAWSHPTQQLPRFICKCWPDSHNLPQNKPSMSSEEPAFNFSHFRITTFYLFPIFSFHLLPFFSCFASGKVSLDNLAFLPVSPSPFQLVST